MRTKHIFSRVTVLIIILSLSLSQQSENIYHMFSIVMFIHSQLLFIYKVTILIAVCVDPSSVCIYFNRRLMGNIEAGCEGAVSGPHQFTLFKSVLSPTCRPDQALIACVDSLTRQVV